MRAFPVPAFVNALIDDVERRAQSVGGTSDDIAVVRVERTCHRMKWQPTVQGWQNLVLAVMGIVVLTGAITAAFLQTRTDQLFDEILEGIGPMRIAAYQMQAALRDQETSVRGYAISADPQFLEPYVAGQKAEASAAQVIREHAGERTKLLADVDAIEAASATWRSDYAEVLIADVKPGVPTVIDTAAAERGKTLFDDLRQNFDAQNPTPAARA